MKIRKFKKLFIFTILLAIIFFAPQVYAASFVKFQCFVGDVGLEVHNLNTDTLKVYLTNNEPSVSGDSVLADLAGITEQNDYAAADIQNLYSESAGVGTMTATDVEWTASGGSFGPFRYVVIYNDDSTSDSLVCYWDYGSSITVSADETFTVDFGASVLTLE